MPAPRFRPPDRRAPARAAGPGAAARLAAALLSAALFTGALAACGTKPPPCPPLIGAEAATPAGAGPAPILVLGAQDAPSRAAAARAAGAIACAQAAAGGSLVVLTDTPDAARAIAASLEGQSRKARARITIETAPPAPRDEKPQARAERLAAWAAGPLAGGAQALVLVDPVMASRAPYGLSGETWEPLAARLARGRPLTALLVDLTYGPPEAAADPAVALEIRMEPLQDVPRLGAPLVYDGIVRPARASPS